MDGKKKNDRVIVLDFVRGISALAVLFAHTREYVMVPLSELENPGLITRSFYFLTGLGREAVMVFFVLSGFFISRSILNLLARNEWTWRRYLVSRMSRLWVVLLPALFLTAMWDHLGMFLGATDFYEGRLFEQYDSVPRGAAGVDLSWAGFLQNALFLVWITTPVFGTNGPLWSLTYEFWYYMMFPMALLVFLPLTGRTEKMLYAGCFLFLTWFLPAKMILLGLVWLMGYAVLVLCDLDSIERIARSRAYFLASFGIFVGLIVVSATDLIQNKIIGYLGVGLGSALLMLALTPRNVDSKVFAMISKFISKISYTLYLVHFSFLGFMLAAPLGNRQWQPGLDGLGMFVALSALTILYATLVYWLFERNTYRAIKVARKLFRC